MKSRNMSIYIALGLIGLFIVSWFVDIEPQIIVGLSMATLFFTIAQMLDSQVSFWNDDLKNQIDVYNNIGEFNLEPKNLLFIKIFNKYQNPPKKQKIMRWLATILYSVAFVILFLAFVVPININRKVGTSISILSSSLLFLSIWLVDKQQERKAQWDEVQMAAMLLKDMNQQSEVEDGIDIEVQGAEDIHESV